MSEWIECSDRIPNFGRYLVYWEGQVREMWFNEADVMGPARWFFFNGSSDGEVELELEEINYWLPMPPPPQD